MKCMKTSGDNVYCLFDIENGKILAEHIAGEYQSLNSKENNLAFLWACFTARDDLLEPLCQIGADLLSSLPYKGLSALHLAAFGGYVTSCDWLISNGLEINLVVKKLSPLHCAVLGNSFNCTKLLLWHGATLDNTVLDYAVQANATECLEHLLDENAEINAVDKKGLTTLHAAAARGLDKCLEILISYSPKADLNIKTLRTDSTPLHLASENGFFECCQLLIDGGADANAVDNRKQNALHLAADAQSTDCLEILLDTGCNVNAQTVNGRTPLHMAFSRPKQAFNSVEVLLKRGADVNLCNRYGNTPLHLAAENQNTDCLKILLDAGCNVNAQNLDGRTPLHVVFGPEQTSNCLEILLERGADLNVSDKYGYTPLHMAAGAKSTDCLHILLNAGCNVNAQGLDGRSPLHMAVCGPEQNSGCLEILLKRGADVNVSDVYGYTPLHLAAGAQSTDCLEMLLDAKCNVNSRDVNGRTALHILLNTECDVNAAYYRIPRQMTCLVEFKLAFNVLEVLLKRGADVNVSDRDGYTPLHLAALNEISVSGVSQCVDLLIMSGADVSACNLHGLSALSIIGRNSPGSIKTICQKLDLSVSMNDHEASNDNEDKKVEVKLDFRYLLQNSSAGEVVFLKTLEIEGHKHLIEHPLCKAFLHLKWQKIRKFYFCHLFLHLVFVILLTLYVIYALAHECYNAANNTLIDARENVLNSFTHFNNAQSSVSTEALQLYPENFTVRNNSAKNTSTKAHQICSKNSVMGSFLIVRPHVIECIWYLLAFMALFEGARKIMSIRGCGSIKHYFYRLINIFDWFVILSVFLVSYIWFERTFDWQKIIGGLAVLLAWTDLLIMVGQLPIFGIYVAMFTRVKTEFFKLLVAYSCLLIGFTASFCVVFPTDDIFQNPIIGFIKILVMMTGELDFEILEKNLKPNTSSILNSSAYIIYTLFIIFVAVVLMNLLVGIAVNDIKGLQKTAGLSKLIHRINLIYFLEQTVLSSDRPKKIVQLLLNSMSPQEYVFYVQPFHPREKRLPKEVMMAALNLAKQNKTWTSPDSHLPDTPRASTNSVSTQDEKNSNEEHEQLKEMIRTQNELISKLVNNECNNLRESKFIEAEKNSYKELRQLKEMVKNLHEDFQQLKEMVRVQNRIDTISK